MTREVFDNWLARYRDAWADQDPDAAVALFTPDASYQVSPFQAPLTGHAAIGEYWRRVTSRKYRVDVSAGPILFCDNTGVGHWRAHFVRQMPAADIDVRGVLVATLNEDGLCARIQLWWERREAQSAW